VTVPPDHTAEQAPIMHVPRLDPRTTAVPTPSPSPAPGTDPPAVTAPPGDAGKGPVARLVDRRIATVYHQIGTSDPCDPGQAARLWAEIDRLLDLRIWLRVPGGVGSVP
jgi:hypothetical protein